ncbi:MAG: O-antigen ligase family protein [Nitrospirae bacterium]|nr:O-antigen ligase family protein [Nitrospirota bacterium]
MNEKIESYKFLSLENIKTVGLVLMIVSLPFSESLKTISIVIILIAYIMQLIKKEARIRLSILYCGFVLLLIASILSSVYAADTPKSFRGAIDIFFYIVPLFAAASIKRDEHIRLLLWCLYVSTAIAALYGIFQFLHLQRPLEIHSLGNQNYTAMYLLIVVLSMVSTIAFSERESNLKKLTISVLAAISLVASVLTTMRASFLGLLFIVIFLLFTKRSAVLTALPLIALTAIAAYFNKTMWLKLLSSKSLIARIDIWKQALNNFIDNPILGIGLNHFSHTFSSSFPIDPGNTVYDAHSLYMQVLSQNGIVGFLALILIMGGFIRIWRGFTPVSGFEMGLKFGALGAFSIIFITGVMDTTLHHEHAMAFTTLTGFMISHHMKQKESLSGV